MLRGDDMPMRADQRGFTLVEMVIVIVITGILGGTVAMFITLPVQGYIDTVRRAELTDIADTAVRRMARDIRGALPNSVRVGGAGSFLEFVPIKAAGRYRADVDAAGAGDPLDFSSSADASFDVLGPPVAVAAGDSVVIYNQGSPDYDVYNAPGATSSRRAAAAPFGTVNSVAFNPAGARFAFASPGSRFQVAGTPVTYACDLPNATLWRYSGYAIQAAQPATIAALDALAGVAKAALATRVSACALAYDTVVLQNNGLVVITLAISQAVVGGGAETVTLQHQVSLANTP